MESLKILPRLNRQEEYLGWKIRLERVLQLRGLWEVANFRSNIQRPGDAHADEQSEWDDTDREAMVLITEALASGPFMEFIVHLGTSRQMLKTLHEFLDPSLEAKEAYLNDTWNRLKWDPATDLITHLAFVSRLVHDFEELGEVMSERKKCKGLLDSLPDDWDIFVQNTRRMHDMTMYQCMREIREEHARWLWYRKRGTIQGAYAADTKDGYHPNTNSVLQISGPIGAKSTSTKLEERPTDKKKKKKKRKAKPEDSCYRCDGKGHFARDCPKRKESEKKESGENVNIISDQVF
jgi:hypothetical protein